MRARCRAYGSCKPGIDGFLTISNGDDADPAPLLAEADLPDGLMNYDLFSGPGTTELKQARSPAKAGRRRFGTAGREADDAAAVVDPDARQDTLLVLSSLTGAVASLPPCHLFSYALPYYAVNARIEFTRIHLALAGFVGARTLMRRLMSFSSADPISGPWPARQRRCRPSWPGTAVPSAPGRRR